MEIIGDMVKDAAFAYLKSRFEPVIERGVETAWEVIKTKAGNFYKKGQLNPKDFNDQKVVFYKKIGESMIEATEIETDNLLELINEEYMDKCVLENNPLIDFKSLPRTDEEPVRLSIESPLTLSLISDSKHAIGWDPEDILIDDYF
ncbi:unnamed protein product [Moneuplotes crassus]|uniref:Uncharacterized protein n=1 Tax=Euplotes crassus TaxID=5936 RepID=A0AAD1XXN0_EUPCR|nr:unnamed protein product [Moneuplotes crassus]